MLKIYTKSELKVDSCTSVSVKTITCELKVDYCTSVSYKTITSELKVTLVPQSVLKLSHN